MHSPLPLGHCCQRNDNSHTPRFLEITNNLEECLGKGGFGSVYRGFVDNTQSGCQIALQIIGSGISTI